MSTSYNNVIKAGGKALFDDASSVITSAVSFNQGDLIAYDATNDRLKAFAADTDSATLVGVARCKVVSGKLASPYSTATDAAEAAGAIVGPEYGGLYELTMKTADAFNPGDLVYSAGTDPQLITSVDSGAGSEVVGIYVGKAVGSAAAGQKGQFVIGCRYPENVLKF